jgi:urocanate hydratase
MPLAKGARSVGLLGNAAEIVPELARRGEHFDFVTDQTAAHDPLEGYVPVGLSVDEAAMLRSSDPDEYLRRASESIARHVEGLLEYVRAGSYVFDYGNNLRGEAHEAGVTEASHTRASTRPISGRSSAAASARSGGRSCPATKRTSRRSTLG